jgi:hypothetical protein
MSTAFRQLPPELLEQILDEFEGNEEPLKTLALVCRHWAEYTRRHRFAEISLSHRTAQGVCYKILDLLNAMPYIRPYIHSLYIGLVLPASWYKREKIRTLFPFLQSVRFHGGFMDQRSLELIEGFAYLDAISIEGNIKVHNFISNRESSPLTIRSLSLHMKRMVHLDQICRWLRHTQTFELHSIRDLTLTYGTGWIQQLEKSKDALVHILSASPQLKHLRLDLVRYIGCHHLRSGASFLLTSNLLDMRSSNYHRYTARQCCITSSNYLCRTIEIHHSKYNPIPECEHLAYTADVGNSNHLPVQRAPGPGYSVADLSTWTGCQRPATASGTVAGFGAHYCLLCQCRKACACVPSVPHIWTCARSRGADRGEAGEYNTHELMPWQMSRHTVHYSRSITICIQWHSTK